MPVRIRLARAGQANRPYYRVAVADSRRHPKKKCIELLGTFDPIKQRNRLHVRLNVDRVKYWLSVGAQPSHRVAVLLGKFGLVPEVPIKLPVPPYIPESPQPIPSWMYSTEVHDQTFPVANRQFKRSIKP